MTKSQLENGMIVQFRNGKRYQKRGDRLYSMGEDAWSRLSNYNEDLRQKKERALDIVKVYDTTGKLVYEDKTVKLLKQELDYLKAVCEPYKSLIKYIAKEEANLNIEFISIAVVGIGGTDYIELPCFYRDTKFKAMKRGRKYKLEHFI